jgi:hypothetical protein
MIQCSVLLCNGNPDARIDVEGNCRAIVSSWVFRSFKDLDFKLFVLMN